MTNIFLKVSTRDIVYGRYVVKARDRHGTLHDMIADYNEDGWTTYESHNFGDLEVDYYYPLPILPEEAVLTDQDATMIELPSKPFDVFVINAIEATKRGALDIYYDTDIEDPDIGIRNIKPELIIKQIT